MSMGDVQHPACERARLWASLALDGELSELEQMSLRAHIGRCMACATFGHDVGALTHELRRAPLERPLIPSEALPRRRSTAARVLQFSAAAAAVGLAAGLGSLAGSLSSRNVTSVVAARSAGTHLADALDRSLLAMTAAESLPASRIRRSVAL